MEKGETNLYELGYLLVPTLAEESLVDEVNKIRSYLEKDGGLIISDGHPEMKKLAYEIAERGVASKKAKFSDAFFGWLRFQTSAESIHEIKDDLEKDAKVLRFLIIKPSKDNPVLRSAVASVAPMSSVTKDISVKREKKKVMTEEELDQEIDQLLEKETIVK